MGVKTMLPSHELGFYALVVTCAVLYSGSGIFEASRDSMNRKAFRDGIKPGWHYFGRKMDVADFEWMMWFTSFRNVIIFTLSGHVLFAKVCSMTVPQKWLCYVAGLCCLASIKLEPFSSWQSGFVTGAFDLQDVLFYGGSGFTIMRCMSFALESSERKEGIFSIFDLLKYNFYLPFFFFGPVMTFDQFHSQVSTRDLHRKDDEMRNIRVHALLHVGAIIAVDIFFHFFYILTLPSDLKFVNRLSDWALAGLAYSNLVYDWVKAAVMFGVINTIARLDHLDPPQPPKCITMLYVFAETHFDRGINDWLCKYVYDHIGENHNNVIKELMATIATFAVTTLWLGPCEIVFIWSVFNCFGLNFELWVQKFFQWEPLSKLEAKMSAATSRRIRAVFGAANFWAIVLYNILALNSLEFALLVTKRLLVTGFPVSTLSIWFITYCGVQLIKERERILAMEEEKSDKPKAE
ncbi:protein-cysteine N-palmitoyltransferase HHAT-like protein isoform X2 [Tympanuchus pallidicinctus]|uniref:protein-cysteine N-palmitoyltransferase HHAT-like protein isoform X2 n=1 Tax=Tympanuchus pallidicinctus TaxID=109042 RepID=UPI002286F90C|nr:protein-cysteine N-palmitoyltransferase HHAT-like protein isoform X2 [Tympanuchus pallidicinctus]